MDGRPGRGGRVIASLTAVFAALAVGLPIFALGERIRERDERRLNRPSTQPHLKGHPMNKYEPFTAVARDQESLVIEYRRALVQEDGRILLEGGAFSIGSEDASALDPKVQLFLGDGARLEVRDGLTPNVQLTLPDCYVEALDQVLTPPAQARRLYWSSVTPPAGLYDPSQNPYNCGDLTLYVPESLEPLYREKGLSKWGTPSRHYLEIWDYMPSATAPRAGQGAGEAVEFPDHYTWLGQSLSALGLSDAANVEAWDVLDAAFPSDPLLWNCGKYLLRQGRKGGEGKRLEDLRKARQYLDRKIAQLSQEGE